MLGIVAANSHDLAGLNRWQEYKFLELERQFAKAWRDALSGIDLDILYRQGRDIIKRLGRPKDLLAAKDLASQLLKKPGSRYVADAFKAVRPEGLADAILDRWKAQGSPPTLQG